MEGLSHAISHEHLKRRERRIETAMEAGVGGHRTGWEAGVRKVQDRLESRCEEGGGPTGKKG